MWRTPGRVFIYNVHRYWMLNIVAHRPGEVGAVLIRALEPVKGTEVMIRHRPVDVLRELTSGPGKLTLALNIDRSLNEADATNCESDLFVVSNYLDFEIGTSHRVGVKRDLAEDLRFYIIGNSFVSK